MYHKKNKYNIHTVPLFEDLQLLKIKTFDIQCMKFRYKFVNNTLLNYLRHMFQYNNYLCHIESSNHNQMHVFPTRTFGAHIVFQHCITELINQWARSLFPIP